VNEYDLSFFGLGLLGSEQVHEGFSFQLGAAVSTKGFFGDFKGSFSVLNATGLEILDDSLFVSRNTADLSYDLSDETNSLSNASLLASLTSHGFALFHSNLELGNGVSLILPNGYDSRMCFSHNNKL